MMSSFSDGCISEQAPFLLSTISSLVSFNRVFSKADGVFLHTSQYTEGPAVDAWKEMYGSRPVFCAGPLSPPVSDAELVVARQHSDIFVKAEQFLDNALEKYGEKSVIFVSPCGHEAGSILVY